MQLQLKLRLRLATTARTLGGWMTLLSCAAMMPSVHGEDWLQFRGSKGDGVSPVAQLPQQWSATDNVTWTCKLPGEGWSSPVVVGKRIYVSAAVPKGKAEDGDKKQDRELVLMIIDADTGKLQSTIALFTEPGETAPKIHAKNSHASPTPIVDSGRVFVHFGHLGTAATDLDGKILWRNDQLSYPPVHGNGGSPVLVGSNLIFTQDGADNGKVICLDASTGTVRWEVERGVEAKKKFSFCTPMVYQDGKQVQVIVPGSNVVQSLNPETGKEIWRLRYEGYSVIPRPIVAAGLILMSTGYDRPKLLAIRPDGQGDVTDTHLAWSKMGAVPNTPSMNTRDGLVFIVSDDGIASCLEAATGEEVWKKRIGGNFSASPLLAGDLLYLLSEEGDTTILKADRNYEVVGKNRLGERTLASMAVIDNDLLIRSASGLWRIHR